MTKRDAAVRGSPDGHVLTIEELRSVLGLDGNAINASLGGDSTTTVPEFLLIGHDIEGDLRKMKKDGIEPENYLQYLGAVDTLVMMEDESHTLAPSLSRLMERYGFAECKMSNPLCRDKTKRVFSEAHCAGNDAIGTLKVSVAEAFDPAIGTNERDQD